MPNLATEALRGAQMVTNTKHRERRSMAETPVISGAGGADAAPATPHNHSPIQSHHHSHLYVHTYYLPRKLKPSLIKSPLPYNFYSTQHSTLSSDLSIFALFHFSVGNVVWGDPRTLSNFEDKESMKEENGVDLMQDTIPQVILPSKVRSRKYFLIPKFQL